MPGLLGKVAVITGASSGIGRAVATRLVAEGMQVAGFDRRVTLMTDLAKSLDGEKGSLHAVECDVRSAENVKEAFDWVEQNLGNVSVLINNAGIVTSDLISSANIEAVKSLMDTNVVGFIACSKEAMSSMLKHKTAGTIININSIGGHEILPMVTATTYCASKFATVALTGGMRNEVSQLGANIRVTSLSPGLIESEISGPFIKATGFEVGKEVLPAEDVAECITFILKAPQRLNISELTVRPLSEVNMSYVKYTEKAEAAAAAATESQSK